MKFTRISCCLNLSQLGPPSLQSPEVPTVGAPSRTERDVRGRRSVRHLEKGSHLSLPHHHLYLSPAARVLWLEPRPQEPSPPPPKPSHCVADPSHRRPPRPLLPFPGVSLTLTLPPSNEPTCGTEGDPSAPVLLSVRKPRSDLRLFQSMFEASIFIAGKGFNSSSHYH